MADFFHAQGNHLVVGPGDYDPGITPEIDQKIRHLPMVVDGVIERAGALRRSAGSNFEIVLSLNKKNSRPRAYVVPKNNEGIREELADAVLLKAAMGMSGK